VIEPDLKIVTGIVTRNFRIAEGIYEMTVGTDVCKTFIPGQFINIYLDDKSMLLPRPISICEASADNVTIIYRTAGKGTEQLSNYSAGRQIRISTPLGNGYNIKEDYTGKQAALLAGGIGIPPMVALAKALKEKNASVNIFLGFQSEVFLTDKFGKVSDSLFFSTEGGNAGFHGNVVELLRGNGSVYDEYFACGPEGMLKALCGYAAEAERDIQVSVEERMGCGYGACLGCSCRIREGAEIVRKSVCKHGPVFFGKELVWN